MINKGDLIVSKQHDHRHATGGFDSLKTTDLHGFHTQLSLTLTENRQENKKILVHINSVRRNPLLLTKVKSK